MQRQFQGIAKTLIERYFYQLTDGCGKENCLNQYCKSSDAFYHSKPFSPDEAAGEALMLFYRRARMCNLPRRSAKARSSQSGTRNKAKKGAIKNDDDNEMNDDEGDMKSPKPGSSQEGSAHEEGQYALEEKCDSKSLGNILPEEEFCKLSVEAIRSIIPETLANAISEMIRKSSLEKETEMSCFDADPANTEDEEEPLHIFDPLSHRKVYEYYSRVNNKNKRYNYFYFCAGMGLEALCYAVENISVKAKASLVRMWAQEKKYIPQILAALQEVISLRSREEKYRDTIENDDFLIAAMEFVRILYFASILAGDVGIPKPKEAAVTLTNSVSPSNYIDYVLIMKIEASEEQDKVNDLAVELGIDVLDIDEPYIAFEEFYNADLNRLIRDKQDSDSDDDEDEDEDDDEDNQDDEDDDGEEEDDDENQNNEDEVDGFNENNRFKVTSDKNSPFLKYPFMLTPATKSLRVKAEPNFRMNTEEIAAKIRGQKPKFYLKLKVRSEHIVEDAIKQLEKVIENRPFDLKKKLAVFIDGEGSSRSKIQEFFQTIIDHIFNPANGNFIHFSDTNTVWFNSNSQMAEYRLIGILMGLAMYNKVLVSINFPDVFFKKLMGRKGQYKDLEDWNPTLYRGLQNMLEYTGDDLQNVYFQTFRICYQDAQRNNILYDLKENGDSIFVTQANKKEFVDLYADFLLNVSVQKQFQALHGGFVVATHKSSLWKMFRPKELEIFMCGFKLIDFTVLQRGTSYDGGYSADSPLIRDFWSLAHDMDYDLKRKLLHFMTGYYRIPCHEFSNFNLTILQTGDDLTRLPTSFVCFNLLLLPKYETVEILREMVINAITSCPPGMKLPRERPSDN
ncbi:ubiquitin-protein ligase E3A-like [Achroia grisella]|uniref:ubiquitin-protein ligase E3A-like n=1 Tax=Achroia grisella TaxID=688607 RepID=UPI0027D201C7|nr:ubiquitin-protein ligase E3A-like [Achroia grisella]XP_059055359.1 ubiquitin-protein ligase E3A-like [Achroia grisella]XP_059055360.1 ubiquitin-protein ligase E3A-like [Achroia grisella]